MIQTLEITLTLVCFGTNLKPNCYSFWADKWGLASTHFGKVRRVSSAFGYGVSTCPHFSCKQGDAVFVLRDLKALDVADEVLVHHWDGYIFDSHEHGRLIPPFSKEDCKFDPPMMVNTACESDEEENNLRLLDHRNHIIFEATRDIQGGETLLVDYGSEYNASLCCAQKGKSGHCLRKTT